MESSISPTHRLMSSVILINMQIILIRKEEYFFLPMYIYIYIQSYKYIFNHINMNIKMYVKVKIYRIIYIGLHTLS